MERRRPRRRPGATHRVSGKVNPYVRSQLTHRRRRSLAVVAAVAIGASLFVALGALSNGFQQAARAPLAELSADLVVTRPATGNDRPTDNRNIRGLGMPFGLSTMNSADLRAVSAVPGVGQVSGTLQLWDFGPRSTVTVAGVDPEQTSVGPGRVLANNVVKGRPFTAGERDVAVLDVHYAGFYNLVVGSSVSVAAHSFTVVGIVELDDSSQAAAANVYLPLGQAQKLADVPADQINQIHVEVAAAADTEAVSTRVNDAVGPVSIITPDSLVQVMGAIGRISTRFANVAGVLAIAGGLVLSWLALQGLVGERVREIGLLKALGWRRRDVVYAFCTEAALLSVLGAMVGVLLGIGAAVLLSLFSIDLSTATSAGGHTGPPDLAASSASTTLPISLDPINLAVGFVAAVTGGVLAGLATARRAAGSKPTSSLTRA
ncbi:MAG TPA: ABC transporter permease [Actinoplanes sp.]|nr:ABC transporter permease [Actinoplanes sp.]